MLTAIPLRRTRCETRRSVLNVNNVNANELERRRIGRVAYGRMVRGNLSWKKNGTGHFLHHARPQCEPTVRSRAFAFTCTWPTYLELSVLLESIYRIPLPRKDSNEATTLAVIRVRINERKADPIEKLYVLFNLVFTHCVVHTTHIIHTCTYHEARA